MMDKFWNEEFENQYPEKDFTRQVYNFSTEELRTLTAFSTSILIGSLFARLANDLARNAENLSNNFVSSELPKRLGIKMTADSGINYDTTLGKLVIAMPKQVCSKCQNKRATHSYKGQIYCETCANEVSAADKKPVVEQPVVVKKPEKKKKK